MKINIYTDGATEGHNGKLGTVKHCGIGFYCPELQKTYSARIEAKSNNEAEFAALIEAMVWASTLGPDLIINFYLDSTIVVNRANGHRPANKYYNQRMDAFQDQVLEIKKQFKSCFFNWIPRWKNQRADQLSKASLRS